MSLRTRRVETPRPRARPRRAGLTLPEVLIATVVLAGATLAVTHAVTTGHQMTAEALRGDRAMTLAEALLDEALSLGYEEPGGAVTLGADAGETTRDLFDDVDDFDGYTEATGTLVDGAGAALPADHQGFVRSVTVVDDAVSVPALGGARPGKTVTVTVLDASATGETGRSWTVVRFVPEPGA